MFGISFGELIIIAIVAVITFGPEQLPIIAKKLGQIVAYFKNTKNNITEQIYQHVGIDEFNQLKNDISQTVDEIRGSLNLNQHYEYSESIANYSLDEFLYQPELDFDSQPELFDE